LKLDNNLAPIGEITIRILKEIPFGYFGIKENDLIDIIIANAPARSKCFY
jgi:hypothetical protein